jgi:uncharacterized membrane protein
MDDVRSIVLLAAAITSGLVAGAFVLYAHTVMPGLAKVDDRTFVAAFQALDRAIINPWFMAGGFLGAPALMAAAAVLTIGEDPFAWVVAALAAYAVVFGVTIAVNVPRNDALKAAGDPDAIDVAAARAAFDEARWVRWNLLRVVLSTGAFALLCVALLRT